MTPRPRPQSPSLRFACGDAVVTMGGDLQHPPAVHAVREAA